MFQCKTSASSFSPTHPKKGKKVRSNAGPSFLSTTSSVAPDFCKSPFLKVASARDFDYKTV